MTVRATAREDRRARARRGPPSPRRPSPASTGCPGPSGAAAAPSPAAGPGSSWTPACWRPSAAGRRVALVTGTNGKTTTTRLLAAGPGRPGRRPWSATTPGPTCRPATSRPWSARRPRAVAVLEVDEGYLGRCIVETRARGRRAAQPVTRPARPDRRGPDAGGPLAGRTGRAPGPADGTAAPSWWPTPTTPWWPTPRPAAPEVRWVGAGQVWHDDAVGCPACGGPHRLRRRRRLVLRPVRLRPARRGGAGWTDDELVLADGTRHPIRIGLPGGFNRANAGMAAVAAAVLLERAAEGDVDTALGRLGGVTEVAGRFSTVVRAGHPVRLLLAKNPAGWTAIFDLLDETGDAGDQVVLSVNARTADGFDTSLAVGRPLRAAGRPRRGGDRGASPRSRRAAPLRRGRARRGRRPGVGHRPRRHPCAGRAPGSSSSATTRPSPTCGGRCERRRRRLTVAVVYPDLLGTYGDGGNGLILARRAAWRGIDVDLVQAPSDRPLPRPTSTPSAAARTAPRCGRPPALLADGTLVGARGRGRRGPRPCAPGSRSSAGSFPDSAGRPQQGVGLLDLTTVKGTGRPGRGRAGGHPDGRGAAPAAGERLPRLTGFENHGGVSVVGPGAAPARPGRARRRQRRRRRHRGGLVRSRPRHLSARSGTGPQHGAGRPAARLGAGSGRRARGHGRRARAARRLSRSWPCGPSGSRRSAVPRGGWRALARRVAMAR